MDHVNYFSFEKHNLMDNPSINFTTPLKRYINSHTIELHNFFVSIFLPFYLKKFEENKTKIELNELLLLLLLFG